MRVKDPIKYFIIMIYTKMKQKNFLLTLKAESPTLLTKRYLNTIRLHLQEKSCSY